MAYDETFRFVPKIEEAKTFALIGKAKSLRELGPNNFDGPVAEWADWRMQSLGETVVPRLVYVDKLRDGTEHRVAWVYHDGFNPADMSSFCIHHIACDCSLEADQASTQEEMAEVLNACPSLPRVLERRAWVVNQTYGIDTVLDHYGYDKDAEVEDQTPEVRDFVRRALAQII